MRRLSLTLAALTALTTLASVGCATRTVYVVRDNEPAPRYYDSRTTQRSAQSYDYSRDAFQDPPAVYSGYSQVDQFYVQLAPYGRWVNHRRYGQVFVPHRHVAGANFRPYTRGQWVYTQYGWSFNSALPFGDITCHYGRWFFDSRLGWAWVPDTDWGPAWVTWRRGGGYVGWAPLPPGARYGSNYSVYRTSWVFVDTGRFGQPNVYSYAVTGPRYNDCYNNTRDYRDTVYVRDRAYYRGPPVDDVRRGGGRVVHRPISDRDARGPTARDRDGDRTGRRGERDGTVRVRDRDDVRGDRDTIIRNPPPQRANDPRDRDYIIRRPTEPNREPPAREPVVDQRDRYDLGDRDVGVRADPKDRYDLGDRDVGVRADPRDPRRVPVDHDDIDGPIIKRNSAPSDIRTRGGHEDVQRPVYENVRPPEDNPYAAPPVRGTPGPSRVRTPTSTPDPRITRPAPATRDLRTPTLNRPQEGVQRPTPTVISTPTRTRVEDPRSRTRSSSKKDDDKKSSSRTRSSSKKK